MQERPLPPPLPESSDSPLESPTALPPHLADLRARLPEIPSKPGIYLYKDASGRIIYVGKAKHLRRRVASYLGNLQRQTPKTRAMLAQARSIDTLSTATEKEALLLEASLIKKHRPRYNIVLRDDKQYILFRLDKQVPFPRLSTTRKALRDGAAYFGPFTSGLAAKETWKAIHKTFPLRRCSDRSFQNRVRPCLYYDLKLCLAPCVLPVPPEEYARLVRRVELLLMGRSHELLDLLKAEMLAASEALEFEKAAQLRDQLRAVERTLEQQAAVLPGGGDMDVLGLAQTPDGLALGLLFVRQGRLLDRKNFSWSGLTLEDGQEVLAGFLGQYYGPESFIPARIVLPWALDAGDAGDAGDAPQDPTDAHEAEAMQAVASHPEQETTSDELPLQTLLAQILTERRGGRVRLSPPKSAAEKSLVTMAAANAREAALAGGRKPLLESLAQALHLPAPPQRIEAVDISHHGGEQVRAGMVVFEQGEPSKDQFRAYLLPPEITGGDDYAALAAWLLRRLESGPPWPDLLLIDGGRGQVAAVAQALERAGKPGLFPLAGIAKEKIRASSGLRRKAHGLQDSVFLPGRKNPLPLKPGSPELLFLQHVRDTVHRFAIGRHRQAKRKAALSGELLRLPGVGPKTARLLWEHFPTLQAMTEATAEALAAIPGLGAKKAARLLALLQGLRS